MRRKRKKRGRALLWLLLLAALLAALLYDGSTRIVTTEYEIASARLPAAFSGYRIVQVSDVHAVEFGGMRERILSELREIRPHVIAVTGDLIDAETQLDYARSFLAALTEIAPVYYVAGNHEWAAKIARQVFAICEEVGVTVLRNRYVTLTLGEDRIVLAGLDDPNGNADMITPEAFFAKLRAQEGEDAYVVLLAHRNDRIEQYAALGADLILCGHGHGGLIRLPFTDGLINSNRELFPSYTSGVYEVDGTVFLVSRGLGNHTGVPRFLNNPHLPVAVLRQAEEA